MAHHDGKAGIVWLSDYADIRDYNKVISQTDVLKAGVKIPSPGDLTAWYPQKAENIFGGHAIATDGNKMRIKNTADATDALIIILMKLL